MKFKITHHTSYQFSEPVFLEPHTLRFRPFETAYCTVKDFNLVVEPSPVGHRITKDVSANSVDFCWFKGLTNQLTLTATTHVETIDYNPFLFIINPVIYQSIPFKYKRVDKKQLYASLEANPLTLALTDYAAAVLKRSNDTLTFLTNLTAQLHDDFAVVYRETGEPLAPQVTFDMKEGSCRDLAWMQIQVLRNLGIAARFVSGYFYFDMEQPMYELHAWVTVYLPSSGWIGLDPSHGVVTGNTHFPVAVSAFYEDTMPVTGGIRGSATTTLSTHLTIETTV